MIETVLGPIEAERLGPTSMHEHLLSDASALGIPDAVLDDEELAREELSRAGEAGIAAVVDPTVWGFGGPSPRLADLSRASGVAIVAGVGAYVPKARPRWLTALDEEALLERFRDALLDRLPGCGFRAGIVGVLAPGLPLDDDPWERGLLRAGARAAAETGSAAVVRLDPRRRDGPAVLDAMAAAGLGPERVILSNVDGYARDLATLRELAAAGATLKWCFGYEAPPRAGLATATDAERADAVAALLADGHARQVLACGIWTPAALHAHGGWGYDHLPLAVLPMLRERGLDDAALRALLVEEPRRLLDRD
ncbi:MAG: phosphotriesterase [Actinobacteria bacterium]|nr:phosphotriesterase [Actinomycetota bacterium]